jgi:hypothetical protein
MASDDVPSLGRGELFREFIQLYKWSFEKSVYSALRVQGGMDNFDYQNKVILYDLRYRPNCGGNPGFSFTLTNAAFRLKEEIDPDAAFVLQLAQSSLLSRQLALQDKKDFIGLMVAHYITDDDVVFHHYEIYHHAPKFEACIARLCHDVWLLELQRHIENGLIFRRQGDQLGARLGRMKADKSKWFWAPLSNEEVLAMELLTLSTVGLPGEGLAMLF